MTMSLVLVWILLLGFAAAVVRTNFFRAKHFFMRLRSRNWPVADATVQPGATARIALGGNRHFPSFRLVSFSGYRFVVIGSHYAGMFALYGNDESARDLQRVLIGTPIKVRYNPSDPNTSYLADIHDSRFRELTATQNSAILDQSPAFDLRDVMS
jgi:hypothetical protein